MSPDEVLAPSPKEGIIIKKKEKRKKRKAKTKIKDFCGVFSSFVFWFCNVIDLLRT